MTYKGIMRIELNPVLKIVLMLLLLAPVSQSLAQQQVNVENYYTITSQSSRGITIEFDFTGLKIEKAGDAQSAVNVFEIPGLTFNFIDKAPLLPVLSLPLSLPAGKMNTQLTVHEALDYPGLFPMVFEDKPTQPNVSRDVQQQALTRENPPRPYTQQYPDNICTIASIGQYRDYLLSGLQVYPVEVTKGGTRFYQKFTLNIIFPAGGTMPKGSTIATPETQMLGKLVANKSQVHLNAVAASQTSLNKEGGSSIDHDRRLRVIVVEDGIYQITGQDLEDIGLDISTIPPKSFRVTNKGQDVAIFLRGEQDDVLDPEDYLEFWGERNEQTLTEEIPELYADPFSDENVYWLEWGGGNGLRMVEENGGIVTAQPGQFNPAFYFASTQHVEKNNHFERLGDADQESLSYRRDLWFFDSGIRAVGKKPYRFDLIYPEESSTEPVTVTTMLSGKSFGRHNVMVWLNNSFVGQKSENWFSQAAASISNEGASSIRNNDLLHGENVLEVQMPELSGGAIDIVLLNWFSITYSRAYRAYNNEIDFIRPTFIPFPNTDLFQFDIDGFATQDIEIYKKGISKIVNFRIDAENVGDSISYKVSFQDNLTSDDVEFIAITSDKKKKPLRIERDQPFDPDAPERFLKDVNNSAEYLIITHERFFDNVREYRDYRRGQGIAAEVVRVQDIYDEFNDGIKSPLAIQEFLRYAFFNWQRTPRLSYVLMFGDASFNYKSTDPVAQDYVPTFFYQTQEFGATATDLPYALIAGEDNIPDLIVGRIPAATNTNVQNVTAKIIEYEQGNTVDAWRNSALFISGNDRITFETGSPLNNPRPAFRSQNSRIIESLVPNHISAIRLNTIRDQNLPFDPNFGSSSDLERYLQDGLFLVNFMGHGGGGIWADVDLMRLEDVDNLRNKGKYPFITSMTCFTGAFENPQSFGLAQKMLLAPERGAIGVLASSGLGYLHNDYAMMWNIGRLLFDNSLTIGEVYTLGSILYYANGRQYLVQNGQVITTPEFNGVKNEMVYQYNLIGDPYIRLNFSEENLTLEMDTRNPQRGDTLVIDVTTTLSNANGYVELVDSKFDIYNSLPLFGVNQSRSVNLIIPEEFPEGTGLVRVYLSNGSEDAAGKGFIAVNHSAVSLVEVTPANPAVDDTVQILLKIEDKFGVEQVTLTRIDTPFTYTATQPGPDTTLFLAKIPPTFKLQSVPFEVKIENNIGNTSFFKGLGYVVTDVRPDVYPLGSSLTFTGNQQAQLKVAVVNDAGAGGDNTVEVDVKFADGADNLANNTFFAEGRVSLNASDSSSVIVDFPLPLERDSFHVFVQTDIAPGEDVEDFNPANNTSSNVLLPVVFNVNAEGLDTVIVGETHYAVHFPAGSLSEPSAVRIEVKEFLAPSDQTGLIPVSLISPSRFDALEVTLLNPNVAVLSPYTIKVALEPNLLDPENGDITDIVLYEQTTEAQPWISTLARADGNTGIIEASLNKSARFAPFFNNDSRSPAIELTVDGRPLLESGLVASNPSLYIVAQDESGINLQKEKINITLNNQTLPDEQVFIPDSVQQNNVLGITLFPELSQGKHLLNISLQDVNGNFSQKEFELVVADGFDIHVYGNYPNPFRDETIFSYFVVLNDDLDEFEIRLYTVSGRFIRKIDSDINNRIDDPDGGARRKGYNELVWDGRDERGYEVANGLYFAVLKGTYEGQTIEKILKVVKLK